MERATLLLQSHAKTNLLRTHKKKINRQNYGHWRHIKSVRTLCTITGSLVLWFTCSLVYVSILKSPQSLTFKSLFVECQYELSNTLCPLLHIILSAAIFLGKKTNVRANYVSPNYYMSFSTKKGALHIHTRKIQDVCPHKGIMCCHHLHDISSPFSQCS